MIREHVRKRRKIIKETTPEERKKKNNTIERKGKNHRTPVCSNAKRGGEKKTTFDGYLLACTFTVDHVLYL
jgi:hypothetical protein